MPNPPVPEESVEAACAAVNQYELRGTADGVRKAVTAAAPALRKQFLDECNENPGHILKDIRLREREQVLEEALNTRSWDAFCNAVREIDPKTTILRSAWEAGMRRALHPDQSKGERGQ